MTLTLRSIGRAHDLAVRSAGVNGCQSIALIGRNVEVRVPHVERLEDAAPEELVERHARSTLDHAPEDVGVVPVDIRFTRLRHERDAREPLHRGADRLVLVRCVPSETGRRAEAL
jgi:hypothetical protein